jgi:predicted ATPase
VRELFPALWGLWRYYQQGHDYVTALRLAHQLVRLAETTREPDILLQAHHAGWTTRVHHGELSAALEHTRLGLSIYRREKHHPLAQQYGNHDPGVCALSFAAWALALLGYPEQSTKRLREAIDLAESLDHPYTRVACREYALWIALTLRDVSSVGEHVRERARAMGELGNPPGDYTRGWLDGWEMLQRGETPEGIARMRRGIDAMLAAEELLFLPRTLPVLCEAYAAANQPDQGLAVLARTRPQIDSMGGTLADAELQRVHGVLLRARSDGDEAEAAFRKALEIARSQAARLFELRAAVSLARLLVERGRGKEALALVSEIHDWFTEGFDLVDLLEARALLDELA